jgi:hypothetical protein
MKILTHIKSGSRLVPISLILVYFLFVSTDLFTTYLASPDLKYEGNWIVRYFNLGWTQILILVPVNSLLEIVLLYVGISYTHSYYQQNRTSSGSGFFRRIFKNKKLVFSLFVVGYFYNHLFFSIYITLSNYLSHLYINNIENIFSGISDHYIGFEIMCGGLFFPAVHLVTITTTLFYIIFMVKRIESHSVVIQ